VKTKAINMKKAGKIILVTIYIVSLITLMSQL
jgi:hypothetical protein